MLLSIKDIIESINNELNVVLSEEHRQEQLLVWKEFLNTHIPQLKSDGWIIEYHEAFSMQFEADANVAVESDDVNKRSLSADCTFGINYYC